MQSVLLTFALTFLLLLLTADATPTKDRSREHHSKNPQATSLPPPATVTATTSTSTSITTLPPVPPLATATPTPCHAKVFDLPWTLTDITIFTPTNQSGLPDNSTHGTISFHFCDDNDRLELGTDCSGTVIDGFCGASDGGYVLCQNSNVAFKLEGDVISVERGYVDDCLGPWPYNSGVAFGQNVTALSVVRDAVGTMATQEQLLVEITAMA